MRRATVVLLVLAAVTASCAGSGPALREAESPAAFPRLDADVRGSAPSVVQRVTAERLVAARSEPRNWLTYYGAYDGQRYSALDQITAANVKDLRVAWTFQRPPLGLIAAPPTYAFEGTPLVVDGVMYLTGPDGMLWAIDASNGKTLCEYHHAVPLDTPLCCGNVNRGAAIARGKVFYVTPHGHLLALDAASGERLWSRVFADVRAGESATLAPLVVKNLVLGRPAANTASAATSTPSISRADATSGVATRSRSPVNPARKRGRATRGSGAAARRGSPARTIRS